MRNIPVTLNNMDKKKVLLVEDDSGIIDAIELILSMEGYEVVKSMKALELDKVLEINPDIILLDIWIPGMNGKEFCTLLKATPETSHIPVIILSASHDLTTTVVEVGADGFVTKPFEIAVLLDTVKKHAN